MQFSNYYRNMFGVNQDDPMAAGAAAAPNVQSAYKPTDANIWNVAATPAINVAPGMQPAINVAPGMQPAYKPAVQAAPTTAAVNPAALAAQQNAASIASNGGVWGNAGPSAQAWGAAAAPAMAANTSQPQGQTAAWQAAAAPGMSMAANTTRGAQYSSSDIANYLRDQGLYQNGQIVNPEAVYERARLYGVSANQLDSALGLGAGTAQNWMDNYRNRRQP